MVNTGQPCYVKLAYLEYTAYVEVIIHSRAFPLYCFVFQTSWCRTWLSHNLGYISGFSFPKISFPLLYHYLCQSKFCVGQKMNNMNVKQSN